MRVRWLRACSPRSPPPARSTSPARSVGRFLHAATKKGVLPGGGLDGDQVLHLATDGRVSRVSRRAPDRGQCSGAGSPSRFSYADARSSIAPRVPRSCHGPCRLRRAAPHRVWGHRVDGLVGTGSEAPRVSVERSPVRGGDLPGRFPGRRSRPGGLSLSSRRERPRGGEAGYRSSQCGGSGIAGRTRDGVRHVRRCSAWPAVSRATSASTGKAATGCWSPRRATSPRT